MNRVMFYKIATILIVLTLAFPPFNQCSPARCQFDGIYSIMSDIPSYGYFSPEPNIPRLLIHLAMVLMLLFGLWNVFVDDKK